MPVQGWLLPLTPANQMRPIATWDSPSSRKAPWVSHVPPEPPDIDIFVSQQQNQIPIGTPLRSGQWINIMFCRLQKSVPASLWWAQLGYQTWGHVECDFQHSLWRLNALSFPPRLPVPRRGRQGFLLSLLYWSLLQIQRFSSQIMFAVSPCLAVRSVRTHIQKKKMLLSNTEFK